MIPDFLLVQFREMLGRNLPAVVVLLVCAVATLVQWRRHPPSARWAFFAFVWFLVTDLLAIFWFSIGAILLLHDNPQAREQEALGTVALSFMEAFGYLFFLAALNAARTPYRPRDYFNDFPEDDLPQPKP
jgi:hypothetical protein